MIRPHGATISAKEAQGALTPAASKVVYDFATNINPLGFPDSLHELDLDSISRYPETRTACKSIAKYHEVKPDQVVLTHGAADAIYLIYRALAPRRVHILVPAFTEYEDAASVMGIHIITHPPATQFHWDLRSICLKPEELLFVCNPNNPTGALIKDLDACLRLPVRQTGRQALSTNQLVVDESFIDFVPEARSMVGRAIVIRSLTKFYCVPGLRIGYIIASTRVADLLRRHQPPWPVNVLAVKAIPRLLEAVEYARISRKYITQARKDLMQKLAEIPSVQVFPSVTNFVLLEVPDAAYLCHALAERGFLVRNCDTFTGLEPNRFIRVAVKKFSENAQLIKAMKEILL